MDAQRASYEAQLKATRALVKFIKLHGGPLDRDLIACLESLEQGEIGEAVHYGRMVRPSGNGSITDWWPESTNPEEDTEYLDQLLFALVHRWCYLMDLLGKC